MITSKRKTLVRAEGGVRRPLALAGRWFADHPGFPGGSGMASISGGSTCRLRWLPEPVHPRVRS